VSVAGIQPGSEDEPGFDPSRIPDAVPPAFEAPSRYGNAQEYEVMGQTYQVLESSEGYAEEGEASWYGEDFHGRPTSSQETYDMYAMTAAHKALPIPTYVEVENLDNGRTAVVRVNDRGPFHEGRIIDLSYAAALKLGIVASGVARVRVRAVGAVQTRR
jgi:rare lipoprotein A